MSRRELGVAADSRTIRLLFTLCWVAYAASYVGRLNYSSAMAEMIGQGLLTRSQAGAVSMSYFLCYGAGQFVNGYLGDRFSPRWMIFIGLVGAALANLLFPFARSLLLFLILWGLNGYFQAIIWPPVLRILAEMFDPRTGARCCIHISSTIPAGTLAAYLLSAGAIALVGWRGPFWAGSAVMLIAALAWWPLFGRAQARTIPRAAWQRAQDPGETPESRQSSASVRSVAATAAGPGERPTLLWLVLHCGLLLVLVPVVVNGVLKDGVATWVPSYISENFAVTAALSTLLTVALPIANLSGAYIAGWLNRRLGGEFLASAVLYGGSLLALTALLLCGRWSVWLTVALFALVTSLIHGANTIYTSLMPMHFQRYGAAATAGGFLNGMTYVGSALSVYGIGAMAERWGWNPTILAWVGLTLAALVVALLARNRRFDGPARAG